MLYVLSAALVCASTGYALAADSASSATSEQQVRAHVEAQRDQLSGAAQLGTSAQAGASTLLDTPVDTDDAPSQAQHP
ncbi:hypothetical protein [Pseudomonas sp. MUP55]|uniref:hypothetical protein n=1 Tax=Pseudomonas sp. MUP55 TaxID=3087234 RepID=UPI002A59EC7C|nr:MULTISPECIES: hypothetical protein [unclassified Pseudomonas]WPN95343.1 hypothetical protein SC319_09910 [Pseudomonas sp. MUP56]WPO00871.1 hypothetical protein SC318_09910 [Pseudomonas sp. MUP55]